MLICILSYMYSDMFFSFRDAWVRVGMCIPRDAEFKIQQWGGIHRAVKPEDWTNVDSLEELDKEDENTGLKLYHDTENGYSVSDFILDIQCIDLR